MQDTPADSEGRSTKEQVTRKVITASDTSEGELCIEMRIRHYNDGAMSKLLASLAKASLHLGGKPHVLLSYKT